VKNKAALAFLSGSGGQNKSMATLPDKPPSPRDPERDAELASIAAEIERSYAALSKEFPHHRSSLEADLAERLRGLK
jgi:hypothetical protein